MGRLLLLLLSALSLSEASEISRCELRDGLIQYYQFPPEEIPFADPILATVICEVERHLHTSSWQEDEDENADLDEFTTPSPHTDHPQPPTFSAGARKRRQLQTALFTDDLPEPSFLPTSAFESHPERNPFRRPGGFRKQFRQGSRPQKRRQRKRKGKFGRRTTASPLHPLFTRPHHPTTPGKFGRRTTTSPLHPLFTRPLHPTTPNPLSPSHPTVPGPSTSHPNRPTTAAHGAGTTAFRRKRDVETDNPFDIYPAHCFDDIDNGDIAKEVECFVESGMIEIAFYMAEESCMNLDSFFAECDQEEEEGSAEES